MKNLGIIVLALFVVAGPAFSGNHGEIHTKTLIVRWQRLVDENNETCERCGTTEEELEKAYNNLKQSLNLLGIKVILEKKALDPETCAKDISQSNRIWINGQTLEQWLDAEVGMSPCETCCDALGSDVECRTLIIDGKTYEVIPANLVIKAGLVAASQLLTVEPCCPDNGASTKPVGCCP